METLFLLQYGGKNLKKEREIANRRIRITIFISISYTHSRSHVLMPASEVQNLVSRLRSAVSLSFRHSRSSGAKDKPFSTGASSSSAANQKPSTSSSAQDAALKEYVSSIKPSSPKLLLKNFKAPPSSITTKTKSTNSKTSNSTNSSLHSIVSDRLTSGRRDSDDEQEELSSDSDSSGISYDEMNFDWDDLDEHFHPADEPVVVMPWLSKVSNNCVSLQRKGVSRDRKQKWVFKSSQDTRFNRLVKMCATRLGSDATVELFGKLGADTGLKEYNALIKTCIEKARETTDEDVSLEQIYRAHELFKIMRESGFELKEETYGQFLMYLIDFGMVEEFFFFHQLIRDESPDSLPRLAYYEMLLWISVSDEEKIQELCLSAATDDTEEKLRVRESLLLAFCESDRKEDFLLLLETLDITKVASVAYLESIFRALGKFLQEPLAERFLLVLKGSDIGADNISNFILEYALSIPNLVVEDITQKFRTLLAKLEVLPTSAQYKKLIEYCCELFKVHEALKLVDDAFESGTAISLETFHSILDACNKSCEFNLVHQINSRISDHLAVPNSDTISKMIFLCVRMKDFEGAYGLIKDLPLLNLTPTASMYNAILSGYLREDSIQNAQNVLKQMEAANVKPDASTYGHLIANCVSEKDLTKHYESMLESGIFPTKQVFVALIKAYASFGQFEKAKQILLDKTIPFKHLNEMRGVLIGALASNGQLSCARKIYEEMRGADCDLDPKAIKNLIDHSQSEGELKHSLELLEELKDSPYWSDACFRVISNCIRREDLRSTVDLLKQLKDKYIDAEVVLEVLFDEVFCLFMEEEPTDMHFGLSLLHSIKEEVGMRPSRKSLDFLLSACVITKDSKVSFLIWKEYETAGLPYNILSLLRMYQALLASGVTTSAAKLLNKIPKDDAHVRCVIEACQRKYGEPQSRSVSKGRRKKNRAIVK